MVNTVTCSKGCDIPVVPGGRKRERRRKGKRKKREEKKGRMWGKRRGVGGGCEAVWLFIKPTQVYK